MELNISGTHGIKNLASWCWNIDNTAVPDIAESICKLNREDARAVSVAGPKSWGRLIRKWVYRGWRPWRARFEVFEL